MFYYTYKVTLLKGSLAGKYYYGQHRTKNLKDGYIGSGTMIAAYFKKYPKVEGVTYVREILAFYSDEEELNRAEKELIGDRYETDPNCLNLKAGGKQTKLSTESRKKLSLALTGKTWTEERRKAASRARKGVPKGPSKLKGKKRAPEAVAKTVEKLTGKKRPDIAKELSSRKWMNNGIKNFRVLPEDVEVRLGEGFRFGKI